MFCDLYCFSLCILLFFAFYVHVYEPLPPGENPIAVKKYISYHIYISLRKDVFYDTSQVPVDALPFMYILSSNANKFNLGRRLWVKILLRVQRV